MQSRSVLKERTRKRCILNQGCRWQETKRFRRNIKRQIVIDRKKEGGHVGIGITYYGYGCN